ncbi:MAG TPA: PKD domain-containing protein [Solirubrobacterales bacterium]
MGPPRFAAVAAVTLALLMPTGAAAATLCVNKGGPQCTQAFTAAELDAAIETANENQMSFDRIEIGPGTYDDGPFNASSNTDIVGAGPGQTVITNAAPTGFNSAVFLANFPGQAISDLTLRIGPGEYSRGLQVGSESLVERVHIETGAGAEPSVGLDAFGATVRQVQVRLPLGQPNVGASMAGTLEDSTFEAGHGVFFGGGVARRVLAIGNTAMSARGSQIENSVLRATGPESVGFALTQFDAGEVVLSHVTVAGDASPGGVGIKAEKGDGAFVPLSSALTVRNAVVSGFPTALTHRGHAGGVEMPCGVSCQITQTTEVAYSALDLPEGVSDLGGPGSLNLGAGNVDLGDPRFADAAAGDYRPRFDSPLIDAGEPLPLGSGSIYTGESPVDLAGLERIVDGRPGGNPAARRDIGAHEYARRPPAALITGPARALLYRPVRFSVEASDPDPLDALSLRFSFDGRDGGSRATHVFTTLGSHTAQVTVTDPTGAAASAETTFRVRARPGRCANRRSGGARRDVFKGTRAGETLKGRGGRDSLRGRGGVDCLWGGAGNDFLAGGKAKDRINGGAGGDRISARDRKRDRIDCGPGRDILLADRNDARRRCEVVRSR